jgi:1-aminocyclopropane-1-carboxylate synthase
MYGPFESVLRILDNNLGDDVHFLWGLSKDFGASGWRIGILYSQNKRLIAALANLNIFSAVSQPMQMILADILMDHDFVQGFLDHSRSLLLKSYKICTRKLDEMVIPYTRASAGLFIYIDFSSLLPEPTEKGEREFQKQIQESAKLVMTPGSSLRDDHPGMFRLCYASVSIEVLKIAMERLSDLVLKIRRDRST